MDGYPFVLPYQVRISDINYGGHVANSAVLDFFQEARIAFLRQLGGFTELAIGDGCGLILPEAQLFYRAEMFHGDLLEIGVRLRESQRSAVVLEYRIERQGTLTAEGSTVLVAFDYAARKPRRLPAAFVERIRSLQAAAEEGCPFP